MGRQEHRSLAPRSVRVAVITVSDTRTCQTDLSGRLIRRLLEQGGHTVSDQVIVPDEPHRIRRALLKCLKKPSCRVVVLTGGTGISRRDGTFEVVQSLLTKRLEGFGELFRVLSYRQVGPAAYLSRACAGIHHDKAIFSLPGSRKAVRLAMEKLILPEITHLAYELTKTPSPRRTR